VGRNVRVLAPVNVADKSIGDVEVGVGSVPPCTATTLRIAAPAGTRFTKDAGSIVGEVRLTLAFDETNRRWYLSGGSLTTLDKANAALVPAYGSIPRIPAYEFKSSPW
jgi:hypothetical protein